MNRQSFQAKPQPVDMEVKLNDQWTVANRFLIEKHGMPKCYYCKKPLVDEGDIIDPFWPQDDLWSYHRKCMLKQEGKK